MTCSIEQADCIEFLKRQPDDSADLIFGSPPYADARTYGIGAVYSCQEWVDWMLQVTEAAVRVSKGLVLWVVSGVQRELNYWPCCDGLAWEWWKRGHHQWRPCIWWKVDQDEGGTGIPGSGGKQWLRNDWEYVLAFKKEGWLPFADPLVFGHEPVITKAGGAMSNRLANGQRVNDPWDKHGRGNNIGGRQRNGKKNLGTTHTSKAPGSTRRVNGKYKHVARDDAPPGAKNQDDNEAPFPEALAEFFVLSFSPPDSTVMDPFSGSGTTAAICVRHKRNFRGCDLRASQVALARRRVEQETPKLLLA